MQEGEQTKNVRPRIFARLSRLGDLRVVFRLLVYCILYCTGRCTSDSLPNGTIVLYDMLYVVYHYRTDGTRTVGTTYVHSLSLESTLPRYENNIFTTHAET